MRPNQPHECGCEDGQQDEDSARGSSRRYCSDGGYFSTSRNRMMVFETVGMMCQLPGVEWAISAPTGLP